MAFNPSKKGEPLSPPTNSRKNNTNDPGFENQQGYYPYDLSHTEVLAPLFGQVTPSMHLITNLGDRHVVHDESKTILNQINGNFLNTINQYVDSFFVSNRTMFPNNWDKLIPNPVKGDDLPNSARPVVPFYEYITAFYAAEDQIQFRNLDVVWNSSNRVIFESSLPEYANNPVDMNNQLAFEMSYAFGVMTFLAQMLSRGQLLDYLGVQFDYRHTKDYLSSFQYVIDRFFNDYANLCITGGIHLYNCPLSPNSDVVDWGNYAPSRIDVVTTIPEFRERYMTAHERGEMLLPNFFDVDPDSADFDYVTEWGNAFESLYDLVLAIQSIFDYRNFKSIAIVDADDEFKSTDYLNLSKVLAYQLCIAQYYTNDSVDNIFTAELYMQLLRSVMFPSINNKSSEPTFDYNGVPTEYDYISYGGFYSSLLDGSSSVSGINNRRFLFGTMMLLLRRSLRYGDKFTTGRTRMLAIGQLSVPVDSENGASVNPVDMTLGLVTQRFLNAANRVGNKPLAWYASIHGVAPSDMPSIPRYVAHRKIEMENRVTTNTANDQGLQTTNLVGYSDDMAFDVFIDDFGILLSLDSFDVLPIYNSGIDCENHLSDRFEYFNPMMQNIGDESVLLSELIGDPRSSSQTFAYIVRNSAYKYKLSKCHGKLCWNLPGFLLKFPFYQFDEDLGIGSVLDHIDPDFIRDKPSLLDSVIQHDTGVSPGEYYHFIVSVHNTVKSARLIQKAPGILF